MSNEVPASVETTEWWALSGSEALARVGSDATVGLTSDRVRERQALHGPNELEEAPTQPWWLLFLGQFANTMIVVLLVAAGIMIAIGEPTDAIVIGAIVILNAAIGFVQEYRAEQAMAALRTMTAPHARVVRDGVECTVEASALVPGDLLILDAGDLVAADARILDAPDLRVNEAALTGESVPVSKGTAVVGAVEGAQVGDRTNMVFKGTAIAHGRARSVVVATGMGTELGQIADLLQTHAKPATPLQKRLAVLGRWLAAAAIAIAIVVFTVGVLRGEDVELMFLTAVSLAVAAIPEALPAVVTIGLAMGAQRMIGHNALIRRLPAVETLGSVTVICTDKTGTLTEGRMLVEKVWTLGTEASVTGSGFEPIGEVLVDGSPVLPEEGTPLGDLVLVAALCNDASLLAPNDDGWWSVTGDPTEGALLALAAKAGVDRTNANQRYPRVAEIPFDSERKRMVTLHESAHGTSFGAVKGAIEATIDAIDLVASPDGPVELSAALRDEVLERAADYAAGGYRVLALSGRKEEDVVLESAEQAEAELVLYGLVAMADPPRLESGKAVEACRAAGITPVMITGDHPATGSAIASRLGILDGGEGVLTGLELTDEEAEGLADRVGSVAVYARTSPGQKLDIVEAWQEHGEIVAMTGDGVNDAPALRTADIGVAMGVAGTEVAKEAADMVLTDDNFASIVTAVGEGRRIYDNIRRFVKYTLTSNAGEIWVMFLGPFIGLPLPLVPVQILWINLVTDGFPGLALGVEPAERDVMHRPPRPPRESIFAKGVWQHVLVVGLLMGLVCLGLGLWARADGRPWQTMLFTTLALSQLGHAVAIRSDMRSIWALGLRSNLGLTWTVIVTLGVQVAIIYWAPFQGLLRTEALQVGELLLVLAASTVVFWVVEVEKLLRRRGLGDRGEELVDLAA